MSAPEPENSLLPLPGGRSPETSEAAMRPLPLTAKERKAWRRLEAEMLRARARLRAAVGGAEERVRHRGGVQQKGRRTWKGEI